MATGYLLSETSTAKRKLHYENSYFVNSHLFCCFYNQAYCQDINEKQSVENTKIAWVSIFSSKKCILLHKSNEKYETNVYEMKSFKCEIIKTNSRVNPYKLTVRIEIESRSSKEKTMFIKDALANVEEKGDRIP